MKNRMDFMVYETAFSEKDKEKDMEMTRRTFFETSFAAGTCAMAGGGTATRGARFAEPGRELPVDDWADGIVCGGGPAGVAAARSQDLPQAPDLPVICHGPRLPRR